MLGIVAGRLMLASTVKNRFCDLQYEALNKVM